MSNKALALNQYFSSASRLAFGCMGLGGGWNNSPVSNQDRMAAQQAIEVSLELGITLFDHADIYTFGKAEQVFGEVLSKAPQLKEKMILQSKCGIRFEDEKGPGRYDFSADWIRHSVDNSLQRLQVEQLDILLLHRPDPLAEPEEVAAVVDELINAGKIKHLGVSNMHRYQIARLQRTLDTPIIVNQLEMSLSRLDWLDEGVTVGNPAGANLSFTPGTVEYCEEQGVQIQSWGSLSQGLFSGRDVSQESEAVKQTAECVALLAEKHQVTKEAIVLAWLMRHPASIQPVIGTINIDRIRACQQAIEVTLSREEWYRLYVSARGVGLP